MHFRTIAEWLNTPVWAVVCTAFFVFLSMYSYEGRPKPASYEVSAFKVLDKPAKHVKGWTPAQTKQVMDLWSISEDEIAKPVVLW